MKQMALLINEHNLDYAVRNLDDYKTVEQFKEDFDYMLKAHNLVVLCVDFLADPLFRSVSYVVTYDMFTKNAYCPYLNSTQFQEVTQRR